ADGSRIAPPRLGAGPMFVAPQHASGIANELGLVRLIAPVYLTDDQPAIAVRKWLKQRDSLRGAMSVSEALEAFLQMASAPLRIDDDKLIAVRNAISELDPSDRSRLGPDIGAAIRVDAFRWMGGKRVRLAARPID